MADLEIALQSLGFTRMPAPTPQQEAQKAQLLAQLRAAEGGPREEPEEFAPQFFYMSGNTFALCSFASRWCKKGVVDLSSYGFADVNAQMRDIVEKVR